MFTFSYRLLALLQNSKDTKETRVNLIKHILLLQIVILFKVSLRHML